MAPLHELRAPARAFEDEADLLVGTPGARVRLEHRELDPLQVHVVEREPAERADGVGAQAAVPVRLAQPDAQDRRARGGLDREEANTPPTATPPSSRSMTNSASGVVLLDRLDERLVARRPAAA